MPLWTTTPHQWALWKNETLSVYRWGQSKPEWEFKHPQEPQSIALLSKGVYTLTRKQILWFPRNRYDPKHSWTAPAALGMLALTPERLVLWTAHGELLFWDMGRIEKRRLGKQPIVCGAVRDKDDVVVADEGGLIYLLKEDTVESSWKAHAGSISVLVWHPSRSEWLLSAGHDGVITLWDTRSRKYLSAIVGHKAIPLSCAFVEGGRFLISADEAGEIFIWDMERPELPMSYTPFESRIYALQRDERGMVWLLSETGAQCWDVRQRRWVDRCVAR